MIKHISFDFWDTLYIGNPNFRKTRAEYLSEKFGVTEEQVHIAVEKTKRLCDGLSEKTMCCVDNVTQNWHLLDQLGCASIQGAKYLAELTHNAFIENPPVPLFTIKQLMELLDRDISFSISCNTGLISGKSLERMLNLSKIRFLFSATLFSDQIGYFKPSPFFMDATLNHHNCNAKSFEEILHVGDNLKTDGYMCQLTGVNFYNNPKGTLDFTQINNLL